MMAMRKQTITSYIYKIFPPSNTNVCIVYILQQQREGMYSIIPSIHKKNIVYIHINIILLRIETRIVPMMNTYRQWNIKCER